MSDFFGGIVAFFVFLIVVAAVIFGGWEAGWWFRTQDTNREAHMYQQSYGYQQTWGDQLSHQITDISRLRSQIAATQDPNQLQMLQAQAAHEVEDGCAQYAKLTEPSPTYVQWAAANCNGGN